MAITADLLIFCMVKFGFNVVGFKKYCIALKAEAFASVPGLGVLKSVFHNLLAVDSEIYAVPELGDVAVGCLI